MLVIDRFEGEWAVIEYRGLNFEVPVSLLPGGVREGDVLKMVIEIDREATKHKKEKIEKLIDDLFE